MQGNSGLIFSNDPRDQNFAFSKVIRTRPPIQEKNWWADGWWGNQGNTPHCCAFSWVHFLEDGPVVQDVISGREVPMFAPAKFYDKCKLIDKLPAGTQGTTIRAGAQVAKELGLISEYRWADTVDEVIDALLIFGPVIAGTRWYMDMNNAGAGLMKPSGKLIGGHAYIMNGVDLNREVVRVKNSYGRGWGQNGYGYLPLKHLETLLKEGGTITVPFESKVKTIPVL